MNIGMPSPATDNLYKFVAMTGVLMLGIGLVMPDLITLEDLKEYSERLDKVQAVVRDLQLQFDPDVGPEEMQKSKKVTRNSGLIWGEHLNFQKWHQTKSALVSRQQSNLVLCRWWGIALAILGTVLWYFRLQRPLDRQARCEALLKERELEQEQAPRLATETVPGPAPAQTSKSKRRQ